MRAHNEDRQRDFEKLAKNDPGTLIDLIESGQFNAIDLAYAARAASTIPDADDTLLGLLTHRSPHVRRAAVDSLGDFAAESPEIYERILTVNRFDEALEVREAAGRVALEAECLS